MNIIRKVTKDIVLAPLQVVAGLFDAFSEAVDVIEEEPTEKKRKPR